MHRLRTRDASSEREGARICDPAKWPQSGLGLFPAARLRRIWLPFGVSSSS
jgi:hypothetical protein